MLLITKLGDIGAYIVGSRFGRNLLMPRISPKKTVEGSLGGLACSVLGAFLSNNFLHFSPGQLVFLGLMLGVLGQLGDLSESLIKRQGLFSFSFIQQLLEDDFHKRKDNRKLLWTLLIFQMWYQSYIEK